MLRTAGPPIERGHGMQEGKIALGKDPRERHAGADRDAGAADVDMRQGAVLARTMVETERSPSLSARMTSVPPPR